MPTLARATLVGALHGPAELLPVSSSAHVALLHDEPDPELRKAFEVALHAGTAAALLLALRGEVAEAATGLDARRAVLLAGSFAPPAVVGLALERPIERRLGTPVTTAVGLAVGGVALWWADAGAQRRERYRRGRGRRSIASVPSRRRSPRARRRDDAGLPDALLLGLAQAAALWPGVSRNGATLTVLRARDYTRHDAGVLSRHVALPVIAGASALKGVRLARRGVPRAELPAFAAGVAASFATTLAAVPLVHRAEHGAPLWPYALYRLALAGVLWWRR
ncbi:MAG: undecaprenyl-diphosphate phosphatase [Actinomycetota bacterium]|nr:undecaprenyl-diphosphate phosphatase [Actinomycetota bacterium]